MVFLDLFPLVVLLDVLGALVALPDLDLELLVLVVFPSFSHEFFLGDLELLEV
jgi:hypothetical protein